jgi:PAS domain S-box-containing protein
VTKAVRTHDLRAPVTPVATMQGLADREQLALVAMASTRMPMVICDAQADDTPVVLANQAFLDLTGYAAEEVVGRNCRFLQGPDTAREAVQRIGEAIAQGETLEIELLNYRKDGATFINQLHVGPVRDAAGTVQYFFASQKDVTERRRAETLRAAEHRLLREVDHRAMNALALVQAFTRLTEAETVEAYAAAVQGRIAALANAHTLLAGGAWAPVSLRAILDSETQGYDLGRMRLTGSEVLVSPQDVQPLALLFHEMMANTVAHGALSESGGEVEVGWTLEGEPPDLRLTWREVGPAPRADHVERLGFRIIDSVVRAQLRGRLERQWTPHGLRVEFRFPLD